MNHLEFAIFFLQEIHGLRAQLEAAKYDVIKYCIGFFTCINVCCRSCGCSYLNVGKFYSQGKLHCDFLRQLESQGFGKHPRMEPFLRLEGKLQLAIIVVIFARK